MHPKEAWSKNTDKRVPPVPKKREAAPAKPAEPKS